MELGADKKCIIEAQNCPSVHFGSWRLERSKHKKVSGSAIIRLSGNRIEMKESFV